MSDEYFEEISRMMGDSVSGQWFAAESIERVRGRPLPQDCVRLMNKYGVSFRRSTTRNYSSVLLASMVRTPERLSRREAILFTSCWRDSQ